MKHCKRCGNTKPLNEFCFLKNDACYKRTCRVCEAEVARAWYEQNKERAKARMREYMLTYKAPPQKRGSRAGHPRRPVSADGHLRCSRCTEFKAPDNFYTNNARPDGKTLYCIQCYKNASAKG